MGDRAMGRTVSAITAVSPSRAKPGHAVLANILLALKAHPDPDEVEHAPAEIRREALRLVIPIYRTASRKQQCKPTLAHLSRISHASAVLRHLLCSRDVPRPVGARPPPVYADTEHLVGYSFLRFRPPRSDLLLRPTERA
jgi:hypothetical protein